MIALSAGGRSAAIWSAVNPPQERPIMPTDPLHQGRAAIQAIASIPSSHSCRVYSSSSSPDESPDPRRSMRRLA